MKKMNKSHIFAFILGLIVATTVSVTATILYDASEIGFTPDNENWQVNNIQSALNDLYSIKTDISFEFVDVVKGGKNNTSSASAVTISKELEKGKYLLVVVRSSGNANATTDTVNLESGFVGTLSGYDSLEHLVFTSYGKYYKASSDYPNQYVAMDIITLNETKTITDTIAANTASTNMQMIIFKLADAE